jgi:Zn finger protein HypA/HybF involved in hydrogenase expression
MNQRPEIEIETTPLFWDCECAEDYIHPASQAVCEHCHAQREEQPDARVSELPA